MERLEGQQLGWVIASIQNFYRCIQGFGNYDIYRAHSNKLGCSLLIHKQLNSYEVKITPRESVDCCFAAISIEKREFLPGSRYVQLGNTENIEKATDVLAEAYTLCKNENETGPIIFGDWNSRRLLWGNKLENKYGKLIADYCANNTLSIIGPHSPLLSQQAKKVAA